MTIYPGVDLNGVKPEILIAMVAAEGVFTSLGHKLVLTSVNDGKHGTGSLHYAGLAFDCRSRDLTVQERIELTAALKAALGPQFDVVNEDTPLHLHVEYQPK